MIAARRMRERMAAEQAGLPPPPPPRPESIPTHEHDRIVSELSKRHSAELGTKDREIESLKALLEAATSPMPPAQSRAAGGGDHPAGAGAGRTDKHKR